MNTNWLAVTFNFLTSCLEIIFCAINHRLLWKKYEVCHPNGHLVSCDKLFWIVNWERIYYQSKLLYSRSFLLIIFNPHKTDQRLFIPTTGFLSTGTLLLITHKTRTIHTLDWSWPIQPHPSIQGRSVPLPLWINYYCTHMMIHCHPRVPFK